MKFQIGEHVICINGTFRWSKRRYAAFNIEYPNQGKCYVIRDYVDKGKYPAVVLQEILNPKVRYIDGRVREAGFWEERFARAPSIEAIKQIAEEVSRWLPIVVEEEEKEDA